MPRRTIPTAILVEARDFHASTDELYDRFTHWAATLPERDWTRQFNILADSYRTIPNAIPWAQPAEPDGFTQFGSVEYPVAFPVTIAKVAKKPRSRA